MEYRQLKNYLYLLTYYNISLISGYLKAEKYEEAQEILDIINKVNKHVKIDHPTKFTEKSHLHSKKILKRLGYDSDSNLNDISEDTKKAINHLNQVLIEIDEDFSFHEFSQYFGKKV